MAMYILIFGTFARDVLGVVFHKARLLQQFPDVRTNCCYNYSLIYDNFQQTVYPFFLSIYIIVLRRRTNNFRKNNCDLRLISFLILFLKKTIFMGKSDKKYNTFINVHVKNKLCEDKCNMAMSKHFYVTDGNIMHLTDASRSLTSCVIQHYAPVVGWGRWRNRCIMLIMTLDPSWRQTLRLPPPGFELWSPGSQASTLPKELSRQLTPVLRIRECYPRSRILIFSHPGSWIQNSNKREG
jgi:hypothetical protein